MIETLIVWSQLALCMHGPLPMCYVHVPGEPELCITLDPVCYDVCDLNGDGLIDLRDVAILQTIE